MDSEQSSVDTIADDQRVFDNVARLLEVSAGQIEMAKCDGAGEFHKLSTLSTEIFRDIRQLKDQVSKEDAELLAAVTRLEAKTNAALAHFQFFDLMSQRIDHGVQSVSLLSAYLKDKEITLADDCWHQFRESITRKFALEQEKELFELMMNGATREEAVQSMQKKRDITKSLCVEYF